MTTPAPHFDITGRVGGPSDGLEVRCKLDQDSVRGRVGGLFGKEVNLEITETGIRGTVGGKGGFEVALGLQNGELTGSVGTESLTLRGADQVTGRLGERLGGLEFSAVQRGTRLTGRLGGITGKAIDLELGEAPGWIGALTAIIAVYAIERHTA